MTCPNRLFVAESGTPSNYTPNNLNQYSSVDSISYSYDLNGNLTNDGDQIYEYDYENRLIKVTPAPPNTSLRDGVAVEAIYAYGPFGRRLTKTVGSNIQTYLYDGDQIIETYPCNLTTGTCSISQSFLYGPGIDEPLELTDHPIPTKHYYHQDGLGSVTQITDLTGTLEESITYSPYGIPSSSSTLGNPYLFTGREYDTETTLYYYRARYYNPRIGRFLQRDPLGYVDSLNLYVYTLNNSINVIDPFGTATWPVKGRVEDAVKKELGKLVDIPLLPGSNRQQSIDEYAREIARVIPNKDALDLGGGKRVDEIRKNLINELRSQHSDWPWVQIQDMLDKSLGAKNEGEAQCPIK